MPREFEAGPFSFNRNGSNDFARMVEDYHEGCDEPEFNEEIFDQLYYESQYSPEDLASHFYFAVLDATHVTIQPSYYFDKNGVAFGKFSEIVYLILDSNANVEYNNTSIYEFTDMDSEEELKEFLTELGFVENEAVK